MSKHNVKLGKWGEDQARKYLESKGYRIQETNYRTDYGEIDLIVERDRELVFVEVKTRTGGKFGNPEQAITPLKRTHMVDSATAYFQDHPLLEIDWRIDVIAIRLETKTESVEILHFENAIEG